MDKLDMQAICPKCGCLEVTFSYRRLYAYCCDSACPAKGKVEHIERTCERCRYQWPEAIIDPATLTAIKEANSQTLAQLTSSLIDDIMQAVGDSSGAREPQCAKDGPDGLCINYHDLTAIVEASAESWLEARILT